MSVNYCFEPFKDIHQGQTAIVMGCGPSLKLYDGTKKVIHVGCNELLYSSNLNIDYYFVGDAQTAWVGKTKTFCTDQKAYNAYKPSIAKFVRDHPQPECSILQSNKGHPVDHALHYDVCPKGMSFKDFKRERQKDFQKDIVNNYMYSRLSITWEMLQFILWTGVSRIYLMGQDCSYASGTIHNPDHHAYGGVPRVGLINRWADFKVWAAKNYPDTKIMCVNPVAMNHYEEATIDQIVEN